MIPRTSRGTTLAYELETIMRRYTALLLLILGACGSDSSEFPGGSDGDGGANPDGGGGDPDGGGGGFGDGGIPDSGGGHSECKHTLQATLRDFKPCRDTAGQAGDPCDANTTGHPDFEHYLCSGATHGLVQPFLDSEGKPQYAAGAHCASDSTPQSTDAPSFHQWYRDTAGVNQASTYEILLKETPVGSGHFTYDNQAFFPLDGKAFGNSPTVDGKKPHNYEFTTEVHLSFTYRGGEKFKFTGDDDLWVFIDKELALDIGGVHARVSDTLDLDAFATRHAGGLTKGSKYQMDLFHAERHTVESTFTVDTTIDCFDPPIH